MASRSRSPGARRIRAALACVVFLLAWRCADPSGGATEKRSTGVTPTVAMCPTRGPVLVYDRHSATDPRQWELVTSADHVFSNVRDVVLQNDLARATYEDLGTEQQGSHTLYLRVRGQWSRLTSYVYGDYTYFLSTVVKPAVSVELTTLNGNLSEARFRYDHHVVWGDGFDVTIWKTVAVSRCAPGMYLRVQSDPRNPDGERELGTGQALPLAFSKAVVTLHPEARQLTSLRIEDTSPPYWAAALWVFDQPVPLLGVIVLGHVMPTYAYQFDPRQWGYVTINRVDEQDAVPERYQVFLGGSEYDGSVARVEAEAHVGPGLVPMPAVDASDGLVVSLPAGGHLALPIMVPFDGSYSLAVRYSAAAATDGKIGVDGATSDVTLAPAATLKNAIALPSIPLRAGKHVVELRVATPATIDAIVVLPFDDNPGFPEAIARMVLPVLRGDRFATAPPSF